MGHSTANHMTLNWGAEGWQRRAAQASADRDQNQAETGQRPGFGRGLLITGRPQFPVHILTCSRAMTATCLSWLQKQRDGPATGMHGVSLFRLLALVDRGSGRSVQQVCASARPPESRVQTVHLGRDSYALLRRDSWKFDRMPVVSAWLSQ